VDRNLELMAKIRGLNPKDEPVQNRLRFLKKLMRLEEYSNMRVEHLSGGSKRKLCCIMALVTTPRLLLMDEASNGVDPMARKNLYTYLRTLKKTSVILITHRIDEAEKISDRVAIMSRGRFLDIDSPARLKEKHGNLFLF
jgi:ABC-type multidrug transport system ATPase subunit